MAEEVGVVLKAIDQFSGTLDAFNKKLDEIGANQKSQSEKMNGGFGDMKAGAMSLLSAFSALAVMNWTKEAIQEAEKYNQALVHLRSAVESTGADFNKEKASIETWSNAIQKATRFNDDQAITSLTELTKRTGDVATAQKLTQLAMDMTVKYGGNLEDRVNSLGLAYAGNKRGLMSLQKEFSGMISTGDNGTEMFKKLTAATQGYASVSNELTDSSAKLTNEYEDMKKKIGQQLIPVANGLMIALSAGLKALETVFIFVKTVVESLAVLIVGSAHLWATAFMDTFNIAKTVWTGIGDVIARVLKGDLAGAWNNIKTVTASVTSQMKTGVLDLKDSITDTAADFKGTWTTGINDISGLWKDFGSTTVPGVLQNIGGITAKETQKETATRQKALAEQYKLYEKFEADITGIWANNLDKLIKGTGNLGDFFKSTFDDMIGFALKKLEELAAMAVFTFVLDLITGGGYSAAMNAGKALVGHASGGYIAESGPAYLHKGEYVVPANQVNSNHQVTNNTSVAPNITISGYNKSPQELAQEIGLILQQNVRGRGQTPMTT